MRYWREEHVQQTTTGGNRPPGHCGADGALMVRSLTGEPPGRPWIEFFLHIKLLHIPSEPHLNERTTKGTFVLVF